MNIFLIHSFSTFFMCGVIWIIQITHYPFFKFLDPSRFSLAMKFHQNRISFVVLPVMILELLSGIFLFLEANASLKWLASLNLGLLILTWVSTFLIQVPLHRKLEQGLSESQLSKLVVSNWIRTLLWSLRSLILMAF